LYSISRPRWKAYLQQSLTAVKIVLPMINMMDYLKMKEKEKTDSTGDGK
jgi:hypothetical protein